MNKTTKRIIAMPVPRRVSLTLDAEVAKRMQDAADKERIKLSDFTRKLLAWALPHYQTASSLWLLRESRVDVPKLTRKWVREYKKRVAG
jgi:hypothetical protein